MRSPHTAALAALLTVTVLAGCGGNDDNNDSSSDDSSSPTASTSTSEAPSTEATTSTPPSASVPESPMDPMTTGDITQDQVDAALLSPEEIGADFVAGSWTNSSDPLPCDPTGPPVDDVVPPQVTGGTEIDRSTGDAAMVEEITVYETETEASQAFGLGTAGLSCTDGTLPDGSSITLDPPQDVTSQVDSSGLGTSTRWSFTTGDTNGVFIGTLAGRVIVTTTFQATTDADTSTLPDPTSVAAEAFAKVLAN